MFRLPKGRKLYHKEQKRDEKESIFTYRKTAKYPGMVNRTKQNVLKIDPFKSYFEIC